MLNTINKILNKIKHVNQKPIFHSFSREKTKLSMALINASAAVTLLEQGPEKNKSCSKRDSNSRPLRCRCSALPNELSKPHESGCMRVSPLYVDVLLDPIHSLLYLGLV